MPDADGGREGRFGARVGAAAFEVVDSGFFTADVASGTGVDEQLEIEAGTEDVLAEQAGGLGFLDGAVEVVRRIDVFAAQEDVTAIGLERSSADQHAFDEKVRQLLHEQAVLPGVGFHLVGIAQQVADVLRFVCWHQAPLDAGRGEPAPPRPLSPESFTVCTMSA
ncbi:hypothetical protein SSTU70S_00351 [Stutzerimonas stutzeri]